MELSTGSILGSFEVSYDRRSQFIYKAVTNISGYFMTKSKWKQLYENHNFFHDLLQKQLLLIFFTIHRPIILKAKNQDLEVIKRRADHRSVFMNVDNDKNEIENICRREFKIKKHSKI